MVGRVVPLRLRCERMSMRAFVVIEIILAGGMVLVVSGPECRVMLWDAIR